MVHAASAGSPLRIAYATRPGWPTAAGARIAVLDSSFNPPTRAHLALATLRDGAREYDAHLLVYSVRNADKGLGTGASLDAREEMMACLAMDIEASLRARLPGYEPNVAVALVDEPLVFAKSTLVHASLQNKPRLDWIVGSDTITRVFQEKYYKSLADLESQSERFFGKEKTRMICVDRPPAGGTHDDALDNLFATSQVARKWRDEGSIKLCTIDATDATYSSTAVRTAFKDGDKDAANKMLSPSVAKYLFNNPHYT